MRFFDKAHAELSHLLSASHPRHRNPLLTALLSLALVSVMPVVAADITDSGDTELLELHPTQEPASASGNREIEYSPDVADSTREDQTDHGDIDSRPSTGKEYDLALGKSVFNHTCLTCHGNSIRDAPRVGDMHVWQSRLAQGLDVLILHALNGHGRMPAKGGYSSLTDYEVSSAVAYVYHVGTGILSQQNETTSHTGCDPVSHPDQCTPAELKRLLVLQMLWLLGGPHQ